MSDRNVVASMNWNILYAPVTISFPTTTIKAFKGDSSIITIYFNLSA
ncbi:hypothetical protein [Lactobacillus gallinarum]|nr:hypothetical protein [Lactobacillus gallinarum]